MPRGINISNGASQFHVCSFSTHPVSTVYIRGLLAFDVSPPHSFTRLFPFPLPAVLILAVCLAIFVYSLLFPVLLLFYATATQVATDAVPLLFNYCFKSSS
ncbi:hypothetical protein JB92DRAFT_3064866 [Gautieria morchelliformis]|nr:hypothetical protein JB92DRAFT_3064866 [Gautieria morchelliformis]